MLGGPRVVEAEIEPIEHVLADVPSDAVYDLNRSLQDLEPDRTGGFLVTCATVRRERRCTGSSIVRCVGRARERPKGLVATPFGLGSCRSGCKDAGTRAASTRVERSELLGSTDQEKKRLVELGTCTLWRDTLGSARHSESLLLEPNALAPRMVNHVVEVRLALSSRQKVHAGHLFPEHANVVRVRDLAKMVPDLGREPLGAGLFHGHSASPVKLLRTSGSHARAPAGASAAACSLASAIKRSSP